MGYSVKLDPSVVAWRELDGAVLAVDRRNGDTLSLNGTASLLWEDLAVGTTAEALTEALCEAFDVGRATAAADVAAFLDQLGDRLVTDVPAMDENRGL